MLVSEGFLFELGDLGAREEPIGTRRDTMGQGHKGHGESQRAGSVNEGRS